jgi:His-Xaa-Ser system protein HxsD
MVKKNLSMDNLVIDKSKGSVTININSRIHSIDSIIAASYIFIDKAYVILDGEPGEDVTVTLNAKDKNTDLKDLGKSFNNELINYSFYAVQTQKTLPVRAAMIQRAFLTNSEKKSEKSGKSKSYVDDPYGIAVPWEKKYGKKKKRSK